MRLPAWLKGRLEPELRPHRHGLYFAFFNALNWQVGAGTPTVLFMEQLGATSAEVGLVYGWIFLLTPVQVLSTVLLPRYGFKKLTLAGWGARGWFLLVPFGIALWAPTHPASWMVPAMIMAMFGYSLSRAVGAAAITTWLYALIPESVRGRYWATDQMLSGVAGVGTLVVCAGIFAVLPPYASFAIQYLIAMTGAWMAFRFLDKLPDVERPRTLDLDEVARRTPQLMTHPGDFRTYLWVAVGYFVLTTPVIPFAAYYLRATTGLTTSHIFVFTMLQYLGVIAGNAYMRPRIDALGSRPFFRLALWSYVLIAAAWWLFLQFGGGLRLILPVLYFLLGVGSGVWTATNINHLARILPAEDRALPIALHSALTAFLGGLSPVVWGLFLGRGGTGAVDAGSFQLFFIVVLAGVLALLPVVARLRERGGPVEPLLGGSWLLRPFRGITYLVNLVDRRPAPPDEPPPR